MQDVSAEVECQREHVGLVGLVTGLRGLDSISGGIRKGELWTIGALPGKGKTATGVQILMERQTGR